MSEYKVILLHEVEDDMLNEDSRSISFEKALNKYSSQGWELVAFDWQRWDLPLCIFRK